MVAVFFLASTGVWAQDVWNGFGGANDLWMTATNWAANTVPVANDSLSFNTTTGNRVTTNNFAAGTEFNNIFINGGQFFLSGNSISLGGTNPQFVVNSGTETINLNITLLQNTTFQVNTGGSNPLQFNGVISGNYGITKTGANSMRFATPQTYTGDTIINGGSIDTTVANAMPYGANAGNLYVNNGGTFDLNNQSQNINGLNGGGVISKVGSGGRILTVGNNNANGTFTGTTLVSAGTLSFVKTGTGTEDLDGTMSENGSIAVNGGTLLFDGTQITATPNSFFANSGGTLGGTGSVSFTGSALMSVASGGTLSPGNTVGLFSIYGGQGLTLASNANYAVTLNGPTFGQYSSTLVTGTASTVSISSYSQLDVTLGYTPSIGDSFDIITNTTGNAVSGVFSNLPNDSIFTVADPSGSAEMEITYSGGLGNDVVLTVVPEPSALVLVGLGLAGAYVFRRRIRT
jgi:autotransporter-associated beta strand protein